MRLNRAQGCFFEFHCTDLPSLVKIGYILFKLKMCVPKPLRCFKCHTFGHVAKVCKGKEK